MSGNGDANCRELIAIEHYPIDEPGSVKRRKTIRDCRAALAADGCAVVRGFLSERGLRTLLQETRDRVPKTYFSQETAANVYFSADDPSLPLEHPRRIFLRRTNGFITSDCFGEETAARRLYHWPALAGFLADCLGKDRLHLYEDPISNMIVNVGRRSTEFTWHFDTNEFTITLLLQPAERGGQFEYVPNLRTPEDERYDDVLAVLSGAREHVVTLDLRPGDLQLFLGRFSLHRVTPNLGERDRLLLIMSFAERPGMIGSLHRVRSLYGKVTEAHAADGRQRVRNDTLAD